MDRHHQPVALVLTRQDVPILDRSKYASADGLRRGGYVLADPDGGDPEVILIATGSEVSLAVEAHEQLIADGVRSRVVSLPCWELFDRQEQAYRDEVLPPAVTARVSIEEASTLGWDRCVGFAGGKGDRHAHLRLLGAAQGRADQVRLHTRQDRRNRKGGSEVKPTQQLHELGQSLWLDNITRKILDDGTLARYIAELSVTGLTSNPTIFDKAISDSADYNDQIAELREAGKEGEELFFELALDGSEPRREAVRAGPRAHRRRRRLRLARGLAAAGYDTEKTIEQAAQLHGRADPNVFIKIPGTAEGLPAIEESIFAGVPINVTLLFSTDQYLAAADAYMKGIERRIEAGLDPNVASVASLFISRWDVAVADEVPDELRNRLGIAVAKRTYRAYRELLDSSAGAGSPTPGPAPSGCSGRAPGPRTPRPPTRSTSRPSRRPTRSTRCPRRRCSPSPTTARSASRCRPTAATPSRYWRPSTRPGSTPTPSPPACRRRAPRRS